MRRIETLIIVFAATLWTLNAAEASSGSVDELRFNSQPICGAACLFVLHTLNGDTNVSIESIAEKCEMDLDRGISMLNLKEYLIHHGFQVEAKLISSDALVSGKRYIIPVRLGESSDYNHYIWIMQMRS